MEKSQHTPAPWRALLPSKTIGKAQVLHDSLEYPNGMFGIAHVFGDTAEQENANCRLIAAAPVLLDALKRILGECEKGRVATFNQLEAARAAIAQAEGD